MTRTRSHDHVDDGTRDYAGDDLCRFLKIRTGGISGRPRETRRNERLAFAERFDMHKPEDVRRIEFVEVKHEAQFVGADCGTGHRD